MGHDPLAGQLLLPGHEHIPGRNFVQIGLRSAITPDDELFAWMHDNGRAGPSVLSLDIDVLDPAFAPGTGTPEPPGLTNRELLPAIRRICHETPVVGMDVVEVAPHLDPGCTTTMNARRAIFEALTGIAMRRRGLPGPAYLDPTVSGSPPGQQP
ncbi:arginase family protein [Streptomyces sp. NPDC046862]|uniref:arginase family protein n=1 Tax=Streptomyces sp. NPDC046862 TaxID=3154603 RepID=UPI003452A150